MPANLSTRVLELSQKICRAYEEHRGDYAAVNIAGSDLGRDVYKDLAGGDPPSGEWSPKKAQEWLALASAERLGREMHVAADRAAPERWRTARLHQLRLEDELGSVIATDTPAFVLDALGDPPRPSATPRVNCRDSHRWWVRDVGGDQPLTPRGLWERAAGAYAGLMYGRDADPENFDDRWNAACDWKDYDTAAHVVWEHMCEVAVSMVPRAARDLGHTIDRGTLS